MHLREDWEGTKIAAEEVGLRDDDYVIVKRRYSGFIGTDLQILLRGLKAETLILVGGLTNICVHYTFADGHQSDYHCRVVEDCVAGSSIEAHDAALANMEYLQHGARRTAAEINEAFLAFKQGKAA
jgi:nicotinamidase-related amidase